MATPSAATAAVGAWRWSAVPRPDTAAWRATALSPTEAPFLPLPSPSRWRNDAAVGPSTLWQLRGYGPRHPTCTTCAAWRRQGTHSRGGMLAVSPDDAQGKEQFWSTIKDLVAGTVGGCSGIVVGQPLDTVRVRLQTQPGVYNGPLDCAVRTVRGEGTLALFKGMTTPLVGNAPLNAIVFAAYGNMSRFLDNSFPPPDREAELAAGRSVPGGSNGAAPMASYWRIGAAGVWAGMLQCVVVVPADLIKCKLQVQTASAGAAYAGPMDCARKLVRANGFRVGLFRGWWPTVWRDAPSFGAYFLSYEWTKDALRQYQRSSASAQRGDDPDTSLWVMLAAGSVAGVLGWGITYPLDVVKSIVQTAPDGTPGRQLTMARVFRRRLAEGGARAFTVGLGTTLLRAVPVNAATFAIYEMCLDVMGR